jgi:hypothetical protein
MTPEQAHRLALLDADAIDCEYLNRAHEWTCWEFSKVSIAEIRFCLNCGVMQQQTIRSRQ